MSELSPVEFGKFQRFIYTTAGISLPDSKKALVSGRLAKRLTACGVSSYGEYFRLLTSGKSPQEVQQAVDLLTTNETFFFREPKHFEFLKAQMALVKQSRGSFRVWSAAASSGEEPYSIAMVLEDGIPGRWEVLGSDISERVLEKARRGQYTMGRIANFPRGYLQRFCLKGVGTAAGTLLVEPQLRERVHFRHINLNATLPQIGVFDVVFLRNVMIYFNLQTKRSVVERLLGTLKPGGFLLVGHSETLMDVSAGVEQVAPAIYRKILTPIT
jgi:chemotaxis protein methyltransferase CheR